MLTGLTNISLRHAPRLTRSLPLVTRLVLVGWPQVDVLRRTTIDSWAAYSSQSTTRATVFIRNVPPEISVDELKTLLPYPVASVMRTGKPSLFRAVFDSAQAADAAILANRRDAVCIQDHALELYPDRRPDSGPTRSLHVTNMPARTGPKTLADALGVPVRAIGFMGTGPVGMYAFVHLSNAEAATQLLERYAVTPPSIEGQELLITKRAERRSSEPQAIIEPQPHTSATLHVSGLPESAEGAQIADALGVSHATVSARLHTRFGTAYVLVEFPNTQEAAAALSRSQNSPITLDGATLSLAYARRRVPPGSSTDLRITGVGNDKEALLDILKPFEDSYNTARVRQVARRSSRGHKEADDFFYVTFKDIPSAINAFDALTGAPVPGRRVLSVCFAPTTAQ